MPKVLIPLNLRRHCHGISAVQISSKTVGAALSELVQIHPDLKDQLFDADGELRSSINLILGGRDVCHSKRETTRLADSDELLIVPARAEGSPQTGPGLSPEELNRYDRHLTLPEVGIEGQERLKAARVLLIGTGGLGSPLGLYLAAAGVGTLGIVDFDVVDESNLQRQVMHGTKDVGRAKIVSAYERLNDVNPHINIKTYGNALTSENALRIMADYDVVVDGTDNFSTRYLVNDACVFLGKPNVYGSIFRFEGQVSVFHPEGGGPCYRCLYPEPPLPGMVPSCAEGGVLGVLPGVIGTLQATEVIKYVLGIGESLLNRLLLFDALAMKFREVKVRRDESCPICGPNATITELVDYKEFCGLNIAPPLNDEVAPADFQAQWEAGRRPVLLDVRNAYEWDIANLSEFEARLIPLSELPDSLELLDPTADIVVHCKSGGRSGKAQDLLQEAGFQNVRNLAGGILRWSDEVDQSKRKY
jgi:sulfur-carrier protein adenylyltransferase/sulfurtransferase